jgi:hypothetical protein
MPVGVGMRFSRRVLRRMRMLMVLIVYVGMFMHQRVVPVFVFMMLG